MSSQRSCARPGYDNQHLMGVVRENCAGRNFRGLGDGPTPPSDHTPLWRHRLLGDRFQPDLVEIFVGFCIAFRSRAIAIFSFRARKRTAALVRSISLAIVAKLTPESASCRSLSSSSVDQKAPLIFPFAFNPIAMDFAAGRQNAGEATEEYRPAS
jgi:hypothetical protein